MRTMNNIKELLKEQIKFTDGYLDKYLAENGGFVTGEVLNVNGGEVI